MRSTILIAGLAAALLATPAAGDVPLQFAAPHVRAPDDARVSGLRFSVIHGRNRSVRGADLGLISLSETGDLTGFSAVLGMGRLDGNLRGAATGLVNHHTGTDVGLNAAVLNRVRSVPRGANVAVVNVVDDDSMVDIGGVNVSGRSTVQVGFLNVTRNIRSVQIGLLNVADNGFLPVFPFFNFPKR